MDLRSSHCSDVSASRSARLVSNKTPKTRSLRQSSRFRIFRGRIASKRFQEPVRFDEPAINEEELEICRQRGHVDVSPGGWSQCSECKMWLWEKRTLEEREDEPTEGEMDPLFQVSRKVQALGTPSGRKGLRDLSG